jgi:hypothetical protein
MTDREVLIERLATTCHGLDAVDPLRLLVDDVVAALAQPEQEPWCMKMNDCKTKCEDCPEKAPQRTEQEPVAWIEKDMQCDDFDPDSVTCEKPTIAANGWEWVALYTHPPQRTEQEQKPVAKPYAYEYGRCNADGTYSVVIEKGDLIQTEPAVYNYVRPRNAHKDWPIKELFDRPPQRTWVSLSDEDRNDCLVEADPCECLAEPEAQELMRCVEAKSRSKNQ